jgi:hypothetical protein
MIGRELALEATRIIIAYSVAVSALEMLAARSVFAVDGLLSWPVLRTSFPRLRDPAERLRDALFEERGLQTQLGVRLLLAAVFVAPVPPPVWGTAALLLLVGGLLLSYRSFFGGDGSDQMTTVVLAGMAYEAFAAPGPLADAGFWFIAAQLTMSYFAAGIAKVVSEQWRAGTAALDVLRSACYGSRAGTRLLETIPGGSQAASWAVMAFEVSFPLVFFVPPEAALAILFAGVLFHVGNAAFMGLNTFLSAFLAAYPAMLYLLR